jgi:hypothetical protein
MILPVTGCFSGSNGRDGQVIIGLQVHPESRRGAQHLGEPDGGISGNSAGSRNSSARISPGVTAAAPSAIRSFLLASMVICYFNKESSWLP